jgi:putative membrane protein
MMPIWNAWPFGMVLTFAYWVLLVAGIVVFVRWAMQQGRGGAPSQRGRDAPLDILKPRYAAGEISRDDFERMKRELL